nr:IclR family transcriptional regulator [Novosphingobium aquimarinum]
MATKVQSRRRVQSIEVGFRVLRVLRLADGPLPLREIAQRASMPASKVHLYLVSFIREGMAYQDARTGCYGLGAFAIQLALSAIGQVDVVAGSQPVLRRLRDETECAIYLSVWGDMGPCIVAKEDGSHQGAFEIRIGSILPTQTTATGLVFLAYLPAEETAPVIKAERSSRPDLSILSDKERELELKAIRKARMATTIGKLNGNFSGVSVPVLGSDDKIVAALTLLGSNDFVSGERRDAFAKLMHDAGLELSGSVQQSALASSDQ